jgi:hypothetical protein
MIIEKTDTDTNIRLPANIHISALQRIVNYLQHQEAPSIEKIANQLADESKKGWWVENKNRFIK